MIRSLSRLSISSCYPRHVQYNSIRRRKKCISIRVLFWKGLLFMKSTFSSIRTGIPTLPRISRIKCCLLFRYSPSEQKCQAKRQFTLKHKTIIMSRKTCKTLNDSCIKLWGFVGRYCCALSSFTLLLERHRAKLRSRKTSGEY